MAVTLGDIARAVGVSTSTASRALSDPDKVNAATRDRIVAEARKRGYQVATPHRGSARRELIAMIVPDIVNPFFPQIIKAAQARAMAKGHTVIVADHDEHPADELVLARTLRDRVDGLIVVSPRTPADKMHQLLALQPVVLVNREAPGAASVMIDNADGIHEAVEHLAALGHRRLSYLNGPKRSWSNKVRRAAIIEAVAKYDVELVEFGPFEPQVQAGVRAADLVVASGVTAVVAYDDMIALGVMARLAERGLKVGQDVSVLGIDDSPMSGMAHPSLTTIHVPGAEAGRAAVDMVLDLCAGGEVPEEAPVAHLETRLVVRSSTQAPPS